MSDIFIEKQYDIIPISVGLYGMFLANGKDGLNALLVYQHLIYTARLQETNQVWANGVYIANALKLGKESIRRAKTFLHRKGLIKYVQERAEHGHMGKTFIRICFISPSALSDTDDVVDVEPEPEDTGGSSAFVEIDEENTESTAHPQTGIAVDSVTGGEQQMLEVRKGNALNEKRNSPPLNAIPPETENAEEEPKQPHFRYNPNDPDNNARTAALGIMRIWYQRHQKITGRLQNPGPHDISAATELVHRFPDLGTIDSHILVEKAMTNHFELWQHAWFLTAEHTRKAPDNLKKPYWSFTNFCRFFGEIVDLEKPDPSVSGAAAGQGGGKPARKVVGEEERNAIVARVMAKYEKGGAT